MTTMMMVMTTMMMMMTHLLFGHLHIGHSKGGVGGSHGFKTTEELGRTTTKRFYKIDGFEVGICEKG